MKKMENILGFCLLAASVAFGYFFLEKEVLFFRWLIGIGIGYLLTRAFFGFAGSVNRAFRGGSTKLMRILMLMFVITAILNAGFLAFGDVSSFKLSVNLINVGLVIGALFTPIAHFSLSGWLYLIFVTSGGILGNMLLKKMKRI